MSLYAHKTLLLSALFTCLAVGSASATAPAPASTGGDLALDLEQLANAMGNSDGTLSFTEDGSDRVIALDGPAGIAAYYAGDYFAEASEVLDCEETRFGPAACVPLVSHAPETADQWCTDDEDGSWCHCTGFVDCIDMIVMGACAEVDEDTCQADGCSCPAAADD